MDLSLPRLREIIRIVSEWEATHGRRITPEELARELGLSP